LKPVYKFGSPMYSAQTQEKYNLTLIFDIYSDIHVGK